MSNPLLLPRNKANILFDSGRPLDIPRSELGDQDGQPSILVVDNQFPDAPQRCQVTYDGSIATINRAAS